MCISLATAVQMNPDMLESVVLASNGVRDQQLGVFLESLSNQKDLK